MRYWTTTVIVSSNHRLFIISFQEPELSPTQHQADERSNPQNSYIEIKYSFMTFFKRYNQH